MYHQTFKRPLFQTVKGRIQLITVTFSLVVAVILATCSVSFFQTYARHNVVQSTEFNLQLVSSTVGGNLSAAEQLSERCALNVLVSKWLTNTPRSSQTTLQTYYSLQKELISSPIGQHILRLVVVDKAHTQLIQVTNSTTSEKILNTYNIDQFIDFRLQRLQAWQSVSTDYLMPDEQILTITRPITASGGGTIIGYAYLSVKTSVLTDSLKGYYVSANNRFFIQLPSQALLEFSGGTLHTTQHMAGSWSLTKENTLHSGTLVGQYAVKGAAPVELVVYPVEAIPKLYMANELSLELVHQQLWLYARLLLIICAAIILLGIAIGLVLDRLINPPVASLRHRLNQIAQGDFSPAPELEWDNEFGDIGRGINNLSQNVDKLLRERVDDEKKKKDLEYKMLQSQISPHFLYNTLNSIKWMATIQGAAGISEMTTSLARLLKNISKGTQELLPLREEIALLDDYYVIQKYRYGGSIQLTKELDPNVLDTKIPRFTLQPLMENAIFHGIEPKGGAGTILLKAVRLQSGDIAVILKDDGIGMTPQTAMHCLTDDAEKPSGMFKKLGLHTINQRLQYNFGKPYGLSIESKEGAYTKMVILLPDNCKSSAKMEGNT